MGWASYRAEYYKNGKIDRKAECDAYFLDGSKILIGRRKVG